MLRSFLKAVVGGATLTADEMSQAVGAVMDGNEQPEVVAGFLMALRTRRETPEEILGAAMAMRERMQRIDTNRRPLLDTCGTGGDGAGTFNISTAVAFVAAAAGVAIAKHGNRAVSSRSGSADVLEALGVNISAPRQVVERCVEQVGIGFLFAPTSHPAMRHAVPIRRALGVRTVFNILGPLTNPAGATHQLLGVFDRSLTSPVAQALGAMGSERAWVVHGADGMDEITLCDKTHVACWENGKLREFELTPEELGLKQCQAEDLGGDGPEENALLMRQLLAGELEGPIADAVALNGAAALVVAEQAQSLPEGLAQAQEVLASGRALTVLERLIEESQVPASA